MLCGVPCTPFRGGAGSGGPGPQKDPNPHLTQCRLGRSIAPYQVTSWSIQKFGYRQTGQTDRAYRITVRSSSPQNSARVVRNMPTATFCKLQRWLRDVTSEKHTMAHEYSWSISTAWPLKLGQNFVLMYTKDRQQLARCKIHFASSRSCALLLAALLHGARAVGAIKLCGIERWSTWRHLYSAGRLSRWALAHILVSI